MTSLVGEGAGFARGAGISGNAAGFETLHATSLELCYLRSERLGK